MIRLVDVLQKTETYFNSRNIDSARLDAELILSHVLEMERLQLYMQFDRPMSTDELNRLRPLVAQRGQRRPLAHVLKKKGFWTLDLTVSSDVLVPRPDTETLVEAILQLIPLEDECYIADIGCGSGCIGLSIASERPNVKVYAVDISPGALQCTRDNIATLGLSDRVATLHGDLLNPIPIDRPIDIVVSNPPYIPTDDINGLDPEVRDHEPRIALDGGPSGLDFYRRLIPIAATRSRVAVGVEVGAGQSGDVTNLFVNAGLTDVQSHPDLNGHQRVVLGRVKR